MRKKLSLVEDIAVTRNLWYYKVPLHDGQYAELALPRDLTYEDAIRLGAYVTALVAQGGEES